MKEQIKEFIIRYGTLLVAVGALVQPWVLILWRKCFRKGKIDVFPTGAMDVGYSVFGPTIGLNGTFRCLNQDLFVNSVKLEIIKQKDSSKHLFDWGVFRSQKLTHKGEEAEFELPYGFMLNTSQPRRYNISFFDTTVRDEMQNITRKVKEEWTKLVLQDMQTGVSLTPEIISEKYYNKFSKSQIHLEAFGKLDRLCYWESGEYLIILKVYTSKPNQIFEKKWRFCLGEEEVNSIRSNVIKILGDICIVSSYGQYNFAYPKYKET